MMKNIFVTCLLCIASNFLSADISGFWQTMNSDTNKPSSVIAVYSYEGKYYGRIIATFNKQGEIDETMYSPKDRAPGVVGNPFYCGLDIVYDAEEGDDGRYSGYVIDPKKGNVYDAELWRRAENLILRGKVFVFGKNVTWPPFPESGFNEKFKKPDLKTFVPSIPTVK